MLECNGLCVGYGAIQVLHDLSISGPSGESVGVLGSNGVGKSTLFKALVGALTPRSGRVIFNGEDVTGMPPQQLCRRGVALVPEGRRLFSQLSVLDNLLVGGFASRRRPELKSRLDLVMSAFPTLAQRQKVRAGELSGGQQQMLAIGRALMTFPKYLLLDEPSLGLSPIAVEQLQTTLTELKSMGGLTIWIADQSAQLALALADRVLIMRNGNIVREGRVREFSDRRDLQQLYLGV